MNYLTSTLDICGMHLEIILKYLPLIRDNNTYKDLLNKFCWLVHQTRNKAVISHNWFELSCINNFTTKDELINISQMHGYHDYENKKSSFKYHFPSFTFTARDYPHVIEALNRHYNWATEGREPLHNVVKKYMKLLCENNVDWKLIKALRNKIYNTILFNRNLLIHEVVKNRYKGEYQHCPCVVAGISFKEICGDHLGFFVNTLTGQRIIAHSLSKFGSSDLHDELFISLPLYGRYDTGHLKGITKHVEDIFKVIDVILEDHVHCYAENYIFYDKLSVLIFIDIFFSLLEILKSDTEIKHCSIEEHTFNDIVGYQHQIKRGNEFQELADRCFNIYQENLL